MAARRARVTAAYATLRVADPATGVVTVHGFYKDAIFPEAAVKEDVERLVRREYAEWVDKSDVPVEVEPDKAEEPKKAAAKKTAA